MQPAAESAPETNNLNPSAAEPAAQVEDQPEATAGENEDTADDAGAEAKPKGGFQKRISELTANWRTTERDRDYWRDVAMRQLQQQNAHVPQPNGQQPAPAQLPPDLAAHIGPAPEPSKYPAGEFDPRYTVDLAKWELKREGAENAARQRQASQQQVQQQFAARLDSIVEDGLAKFGQDFNDAMNGMQILRHPQIGQVLREAIADSDVPADVAMALAKDKDAQEAIAKARTPAAVARVVGRLEARLSAAPPQPKPTAAPPPPPRLAKGAAAAVADPAKMSADDYYNWRMKQV